MAGNEVGVPSASPDSASATNVAPPPTTDGHLLGGQVHYTQPKAGFRSGIEPVLLSAAIPARGGEHVLEGGSGAGAALLCLTARIPAVRAVGVEREPSLVALATHNAEANRAANLTFMAADVTALSSPDLRGEVFDHAFANPPYHAAEGTPSPMADRARAKQGAPGLLAAWAGALAAPLRHRGTLTFILPAGSLPECLTALAAAGCPASAVLPLWPKPGRVAKLVIVRGVKGGRGSLRLLPGLTLHKADGGYTVEADAILRGGGAVAME